MEQLKFAAGMVALLTGVFLIMILFFTALTELDQLKDRWGCEGHQEILFIQTEFVKYDGQRVKDVAYSIVTNPQQKGDILSKLSTNTYQAYNQWGGSSLYKSSLAAHGDVVSFDRPTRSRFYYWEYYYVL